MMLKTIFRHWIGPKYPRTLFLVHAGNYCYEIPREGALANEIICYVPNERPRQSAYCAKSLEGLLAAGILYERSNVV